ncbi:MAG: HD domain-containing protein [Huintestinicola sp.]
MKFYKYRDSVYMQSDSEASFCQRYSGGSWVNEGFLPESAEELSFDEAERILEEKIARDTAMTEKARELAKQAHAGQRDKAGIDYFEGHLSAVAKNAANSPYGMVVGYLHDILEDTDMTEEELSEQFPDFIADAVKAMTHLDTETYDEYLQRVKKNPIAKAVKIADLSHNMDLKRLPNVTRKDTDRVMKYSQAMAFLYRK